MNSMTRGTLHFSLSDSATEVRIDEFLSQMTLEEKVGQMVQISIRDMTPGEGEERIRRGQAGSVLTVYGAKETNRLQKIAVEESRLSIPLIIGNDVIHGYRTIFPIPLAESCTWEPGLAQETARIAAEEATAHGTNWTFAPMVDICRDPRWGRIAEGSGEDPFLGRAMARARVFGFQAAHLASGRKMVTCPKH
jgi:beta-glucosidase